LDLIYPKGNQFFVMDNYCPRELLTNKALAKLALWGFVFVSACAVGQTPNVPMWVGIKLFFKMCGGENI
jgi:hypothetical protein